MRQIVEEVVVVDVIIHVKVLVRDLAGIRAETIVTEVVNTVVDK